MPLTGNETEVPVYIRLANGTIHRAGLIGLSRATADLLYLPLSGGTLTGPLGLSGPPTNPLHAATKAYVDSVGGGGGGGEPAAMSGYWLWSATTSGAPDSGYFKALNADPLLATTIRLSLTQSTGATARWLSAPRAGDLLVIRPNNDELGDSGLTFTVTDFSDVATYATFNVSNGQALSSGIGLGEGEECIVALVPGGASGGGGLDQATADTLYVNLTGDTMTGALLIGSVLEVTGANNIRMRGNAGTQSGLSYFGGATGTNLRWWLKRNSTAEAGANAGSDLQLDAYDDTGNFLSNPFIISRATGLITVKADPQVALGVATKNYVDTADGLLAPKASPTFTGTPLSTTAAVDTNTTQIATTAFVVGQAASVAPLMNGTQALGTSLKYARQDHVHASDTSRAPLASPALTGTPTSTTAAVDTNTTQIATTAFVVAQASATLPAMNGTATIGTSLRYARQDHIHASDTSRAPLASPSLTGTPLSTTAAADTNTTQIATTAFVLGQASAVVGAALGTAAIGSSLRYARADHVHAMPTAAQVGALSVGGGTVSGSITGTYFIGTGVQLTSADGVAINTSFQTAGVNRWTFGKAPGAEGGGNTGATFTVARWDNAGAWIDNPISINRADGVVAFQNQVWLGQTTPTAGNHAASKDYVDARTPKITPSTTAPSSPAVNDIWVDLN